MCGTVGNCRAKIAEEKLYDVFVSPFFFFHRGTFVENLLTLGLLDCQAESPSVCFEPRFDTLTLKRQLHKFTLCQINQ